MRLSNQVLPLNYELLLRLDPLRDDFSGSVAIEVEASLAQPHVVLHAAEMEVAGAIRLDSESIRIDQPLAPGRNRLELAFQGRLNPRLRGLYRSVANDGRQLIVSQGEPNYARLFFPCFDEPSLKATFAITLEVPSGLTALSNGEQIAQEELGGGLQRIRFAPTCRMSSYLVALVVGDLEAAPHEMVDGVKLQVWTTPGQSHLVEFAHQVAAHSLRDYKQYFGCPYPLSKLDLIGVPDFGSGAMENLGAIIFRETNLLAREETSSRQVLHELALTVAHEISHMWFGDLVTMEWWDDLWLNEAFATWMMVRAVDRLRPEFGCWERFADSRQRAQEPDGLLSTRPIYAPVESPDQMAEMFDVITYNKGAAVLKMLEEFLGAETFQQGVASYISRHQFGNANGGHLWQALEEASGKPVGAMMHSWLTQPGYPLVTAERHGDRVLLRQQRFLYSGAVPQDQLWPIPLVYRVGEKTHRLILDEAEQWVSAEAGELLLNAGSFGYYRAEPGPTPLDPKTLSISERVNQVHDAWALVLNGSWPLQRFWELAEAWCPGETAPNVWQAFLDAFLDLQRAGCGELSGRVLDLIPSQPTGDVQLVARLTAARATLGQDSSRLDWARSQLAHPEQPEWFEAALQVLAFHGDEQDYQRIHALWKAAGEPNLERRLMLGMAGFRQPELVVRNLRETLDGGVRPQDGGHLILALSKNPAAVEVLWNWVSEHWEQLCSVLPMQGMRLFLQGVPHLILPGRFAEIRDFLSQRPVEGGRRQLQQGLERLEIGLRLHSRVSSEPATVS